MRESQTEAIKESMKQFDEDLVEIPVHDDPCETCAPYQGQVYSVSGKSESYPELPDGGPPWHPNCLLPGTRCISPGGIVAGHRALYRGEAIELSFSHAAQISVTPNHMFLTPLGFAPARLLRQGDEVFYCPDFEGIISRHPNGHEIPTPIEDIVRSLSETAGVSSGVVPVSPEYLHGDGRFCNGDIDVVWADGLLENARQALLFQERGEHSLDSRRVALLDLFPLGALAEIFRRAAHSADSIMGGRRTPSPVFLARARGGNPMGFTDAPDRDSSQDKPAVDSLGKNSKTLSQILFEAPGLIKTTKLIDVRVFQFSGHVYDLQSATSLYLGNSLMSSNCEDVANPVSENILAWRKR